MCCENCQSVSLEGDIQKFIQECLVKEHPESYLIAVLHKVQGRYGFLSQRHLDEVAHLLGVPTSTVSGVATFYHYFRLKPQGKYALSVCLGTACFVKGADKVVHAFKEQLKIDIGDVTPDGKFSIDTLRCVGGCALAPIVMVGDKVYGNVTPGQVKKILADF